MKTWWTELAPRERLLVMIAAGLTALAVIWQFVLVPAVGARDAARERAELASRDLTRLQHAFMEKRAGGAVSANLPGQSQLSPEGFKSAVTGAASDKGLSIARLQSGEGAEIGLVLEPSDPRLIFAWLEEVETRHGGRITRLTMEQAGGGAVRMTVDIEGQS